MKIKQSVCAKKSVIAILAQWMTVFTAIVVLINMQLLPIKAAIRIPEPTEQFYVADFANVLTQETEDYIVSKNDALFGTNGAQIVVATVDFLDGYEIEDYAYAMFNEWEIGSKTKNNGVLLLLVIGEENYWMLQGKGLEDTLSSGIMKSILSEDMEPFFAIGDYNTGVIETFKSVTEVIEGVYGPAKENPGSGWNDPQPSQTPGSSVGSAFVMIGSFLVQMFFIIIFFIVISSMLRGRRYRRGFGPIFFPRPRYHRPMYRRDNHWSGTGMGGFGGPRPGGRGGSFGGGGFRSGGGSRTGGGGSRMGGGGSSRGGGAGRH